MSKRQDADLKKMRPAQLRAEVMKMRRALRKHRALSENSRCWHCDLQLYEVLPDSKPAGKMTKPEPELLRNCRRYIRQQQCDQYQCKNRPK
ncbi:MAG: hypothetical protein AAB389_02330 [Patescibacteria group bacterium]